MAPRWTSPAQRKEIFEAMRAFQERITVNELAGRCFHVSIYHNSRNTRWRRGPELDEALKDLGEMPETARFAAARARLFTAAEDPTTARTAARLRARLRFLAAIDAYAEAWGVPPPYGGILDETPYALRMTVLDRRPARPGQMAAAGEPPAPLRREELGARELNKEHWDAQLGAVNYVSKRGPPPRISVPALILSVPAPGDTSWVFTAELQDVFVPTFLRLEYGGRVVDLHPPAAAQGEPQLSYAPKTCVLRARLPPPRVSPPPGETMELALAARSPPGALGYWDFTVTEVWAAPTPR